MFKSLTLVVALGILIASCGNKDEKQMPTARPVKYIVVQKKRVPVTREYQGEIYGQLDIPIRARVDGYLEKIYFQEGSFVKKGAPLYLIDDQPYRADVAAKESNVAMNESQWVKAKNDLDRMRPLAEVNAISQKDLDASIASEEASKNMVQSSKEELKISQLNLGYTYITSPISGIIGKSDAKEGEYVGKNPNPVILNTVSKLDTILVEFFLAETEYLEFFRHHEKEVKAGRAEIGDRDSLRLMLSDGVVHGYGGTWEFIDRNVDPTTGSILVQASFPNPSGIIRPGQYGKVIINLANSDQVVVPQRCVQELQGMYRVFVVNNGKVELREIKIGPSYADYYIVLDGLKVGDQVVLEGIQMIRSGMEVIPTETQFKSVKSK